MSDYLTLAFLYRIFGNVIIKQTQLNYIRTREPQLSPCFFYIRKICLLSSVFFKYFLGI